MAGAGSTIVRLQAITIISCALCQRWSDPHFNLPPSPFIASAFLALTSTSSHALPWP